MQSRLNANPTFDVLAALTGAQQLRERVGDDGSASSCCSRCCCRGWPWHGCCASAVVLQLYGHRPMLSLLAVSGEKTSRSSGSSETKLD